MNDFVLIGILFVLLLSGCTSSGKPQWENKYGAVEKYCESINSEYIYGGIYHEGCVKDGKLVEIVCPSTGNCAEVNKQ